ncbi:MAG: hypothetical protein KC729_00060 [Candidatus Eisenbacteria bacterium]|uniref:Uncharacterized protein n=1 Tax=Eiseniibacteriota bacterium TaxID=2212470 RepID=A0A956RMG9_UNCEI|nr:hypothetical protein [Candidatus Eisenbacteria bacterium]
MILLPGQIVPPPPPPIPNRVPIDCECGKRSVVPKVALDKAGNTIRCPWCDSDWIVRHYTNLLTGKVTVHLAKRRLDDIWLPEGFVR